MSCLTDNEKEYYRRHFSLPGFDEETQGKLKNARVIVIGAGGLAAPCLLYLAGAGVGTIAIVDGDTISASNLPRQVIFNYESVGESKAEYARTRISALNPFIQVETYAAFLDANNAKDIIERYEIVVDCTDNFETKYRLNDICEQLGKPLVYASIFQYEGQLAVFHVNNDHGISLSYRDLFPAPPQAELRENCSDAGVLGVLPGVLGTLQAGEVLKLITGIGNVLCDRVMIYDSLSNRSSLLTFKKRSHDQTNSNLGEGGGIKQITNVQLIQWKVVNADLIVLDVREKDEREMISIGGIHIPMRQLPNRLMELPRDKKIVCICKLGSRSKGAVLFLRDQGFNNVYSLIGGVMGLTQDDMNILRKETEGQNER